MRALSFIKLAALSVFLFAILSISLPAQSAQDEFEGLRHGSAIGKKLYVWYNVVNDKKDYDASIIYNFIKDNPDWPKIHVFREKLETHLEDLGRSFDPEKWFEKDLPETYEGITFYIDWLLTNSKQEKAHKVLVEFWKTAHLDRRETQRLHSRYQNAIQSEADAERINYLIWEQRYNEASYVIPYMDDNDQNIYNLRIALGRGDGIANQLVRVVSDEDLQQPGLLYDRVRWRRIKDMTDEAIDLIQQQPENPDHAELWWQERNILTRRLIEDRKYEDAYELASNGKYQKGSQPFAEAEWLAGWLALTFLKEPEKAYSHFENFYQSVNSAISSSRAAYWLGRADEAMSHKDSSSNWYQLSAQFPSTFYGQLSEEKMKKKFNSELFLEDKVSEKDAAKFEAQTMVQAIRLLKQNKLERYSDAFFIKLFLKAKTRTDYLLIANFAKEVGITKYAVDANRRMQQNLGVFMYNIGYPSLKYTPHKEADRALINAIIYRESMFDKGATSDAGARGLMQLMPATAKAVSKQVKTKYNNSQLTTSAEYNVKLGYAYLEDLVEKYDGFYPLAIAAYNAGPGNVSKWIKAFGDPRTNGMDLADWVELIPIYETRNYVQRVMETYYIYQLKFGQKPKTIEGFR